MNNMNTMNTTHLTLTLGVATILSTSVLCAKCHGIDVPWLVPDLNGDGVINVLDVHLARFGGADGTDSRDEERRVPPGGIAGGDMIAVSPDPLLLKPNGVGTVTLSLLDNTTPLFGYSLSVHAVPAPGARGTVSAVVASTNFGAPFNLLDAAPSNPPVDPLFTVILPWASDGVFLSTNTADGSVVLAGPGVNDALAEVAFEASSDAAGTWTIQLGPASALSDGDGFAVAFAFAGGTIDVVGRPGFDPDFNGDGSVDGADLGLLLGDWGPCDTLPPDLNMDGIVNGGDLGLLLAVWGSGGGPSDLNQDGDVNGADLGVLLGDWGLTLPPCADLTGDGLVDGADLGVFLSEFGS